MKEENGTMRAHGSMILQEDSADAQSVFCDNVVSNPGRSVPHYEPAQMTASLNGTLVCLNSAL